MVCATCNTQPTATTAEQLVTQSLQQQLVSNDNLQLFALICELLQDGNSLVNPFFQFLLHLSTLHLAETVNLLLEVLHRFVLDFVDVLLLFVITLITILH